jgi:3-hydroxymyristoyl/3-hydroxydecanoyl-(acyl carrier protein) dehydratase
MKWYSLRNTDLISSNEIIMEAAVGPDSPWFSGHFPGEPILPGIAQLAMALDAIKKLNQKNLRISGVKRIRFKQVIRPDDKLRITVAPHKKDALSYLFRIMVNGELASNGILMVEELDK